MKRLLIVAMIVMAATALYGEWMYDSDFALGPNPHSVVVDNNGRVWVGYYGYTDTLGLPNDTIPIKPIYCYEPDGSQASFSPIQMVTVGSRVDTMWNGCRGMSLDNNGNILYSAYNDVWQINAQTGEGLGALYDFPGSITEASMSADGYMFVTQVVPGGNPIWVFDASLGLPSDYTGAAADSPDLVNLINDGTNTAISRNVLVDNSGMNLYHARIYGGTHNNGVFHYYSEDGPEGEFMLKDILYNEVMWGQSLDWGLDSTVWVGTYWDVADGDFTGWYELDPGANHQIVGTIGTPTGDFTAGTTAMGDTIRAPRGIAFSTDGMTAYVSDFDGNRITKFMYAPASVTPEDPQILRAFSLAQNYPNPFNPTTTIEFELYKDSHVTLTVYDITGRQVTTLVNENLTIGRHNVDFHAGQLASGMYIYTLTDGQQMVTNRMLLVK